MIDKFRGKELNATNIFELLNSFFEHFNNFYNPNEVVPVHDEKLLNKTSFWWGAQFNSDDKGSSFGFEKFCELVRTLKYAANILKRGNLNDLGRLRDRDAPLVDDKLGGWKAVHPRRSKIKIFCKDTRNFLLKM